MKKKLPKDSGWIEYINPEYDEEFEKSVEGDIPQLKIKTRDKVKNKKFKLDDPEGNNLFNKKNNKSRKTG